MGQLVIPPPFEVAEQQRKRALREAVTHMLMVYGDKFPRGPEKLPQTEKEAEFLTTGPALRRQRPLHERAVQTIGEYLPKPIDPETGMPDVELGVSGMAGKAAKPIEELFLNFRRMRISPQEEQALRQATRKTIEERGLYPKTVEAHEKIRKLSETLRPDEIDEAARLAVGTKGRAARYTMQRRITALNKEIVDKRRSLDQLLTKEETIAAERELGRMGRDLDEYLQFTGIRSEMGRNLAALKMEVDSTLDLSYWAARAQRELGLPPGVKLPADKLRPIQELIADANQAIKAGNNLAADRAKEALARRVAKMRETGWLEMVVTLRKAGLLTGVRTHARNILGTASFNVLEELSSIPSSIVDIGLSLGTGRRTVAGPSTGFWRAIRETATSEGRAKASSILKGSENLQKYELLRGLNFKPDTKSGKLVNAYANSVFKALSYEDQLFKTFALHRSLEKQSRLVAINEGLKGQRRTERIQELVSSPTEPMMAEAIKDAEFATFNNPNIIAERFAAAKRWGISREGDAGKVARVLSAAMDMTVPFVRTPTNITARVIDYSPVGTMVKVPWHSVLATVEGSLSPQRQKAISEAVGRGATGSALILLGYYLAESGAMTGTVEESSAQRAVSRAAGKRAGAIRIGDQWMGIETLSPVGNTMVVGATMFREGIKPAELMTKLPTVGAVAGKTVTEQPVLTGLEDFLRAVKSPVRSGQRLAESYVGSFVPTIVSDIGTLIDPAQALRTTTRGDVSSIRGLTEAVARRLPVVRQFLPFQRDVFWDPVRTRPTGFFDPFLTTPATKDVGKAEVDRLRIGISYPKQEPEGESVETFAVRSQLYGRLLKGAVNAVATDRGYTSLDDASREYSLRGAIRKTQTWMSKLKKDQSKMSDEERRLDLRVQVETAEIDPVAAWKGLTGGI